METFRFEVFFKEPIVHYKDNSGTIELLRLMKIQSHTKKINVVFHKFLEYVGKGLIHIYNKFLQMNSVLTHVLSCFHRTFS